MRPADGNLRILLIERQRVDMVKQHLDKNGVSPVKWLVTVLGPLGVTENVVKNISAGRTRRPHFFQPHWDLIEHALRKELGVIVPWTSQPTSIVQTVASQKPPRDSFSIDAFAAYHEWAWKVNEIRGVYNFMPWCLLTPALLNLRARFLQCATEDYTPRTLDYGTVRRDGFVNRPPEHGATIYVPWDVFDEFSSPHSVPWQLSCSPTIVERIKWLLHVRNLIDSRGLTLELYRPHHDILEIPDSLIQFGARNLVRINRNLSARIDSPIDVVWFERVVEQRYTTTKAKEARQLVQSRLDALRELKAANYRDENG